MLEALRRNSRNTIIYVLFGVIIAVFVINFGPGSRGCTGGASVSYAAKVGSSTIGENDFRFAYVAGGYSNFAAGRARPFKEFTMSKLIERELLADEAERLGFSVSTKEAEDMVYDGRMFVLGMRRNVDAYVYVDGVFDYKRFKTLCQNQFGVTEAHFIEQQQRELMAERVRELMLTGTKVAPDEVKEDFESKGRQVNLEFVRFSPRRYADQVSVGPADVEAYKKAHEADLKKYYEEHAYLYKKIDKEAHLLRVSVAVPPDAKDEVVAAARAKAEEAAKRIKAGQPFADVARALSDDERSRARGGDAGWPKKGMTGFGQALEEKVFAAKKGDVVGPERGARGFEVLRVVDFREGDVPFEAVAGEIADDQLRNEKAKEKAKADAEAAMAKLKAGEKLATLFPKPTDSDESDPLKKLNGPPQVQETGMFSRRGDMVQDLGVSAELVKRAFELKPGEAAGPFDVSGSYAVVVLKERKEPDMADFTKRKGELERQYERQKWAEVVNAWSKQKCVEMRDSHRITVNDEVLAAEGAPTGPQSTYDPCGGPRF